jgi:hypothetical protein
MKVHTGMEQVESLRCINWHLHEVLGSAPATILMIFFCKVKFFLLLEELLPKIIPCTMCPYSCHFTLCIHTAAMLHYMSYSCYVALCIHTTAMLHYVSTQLPVTLCPYSCHVALCVHTAAMLHYVYIQLPCYTMCPHSCLLHCVHTAAMLHCVSTQLLCCTTFHKNITLRTFLQQCTTTLHIRALK